MGFLFRSNIFPQFYGDPVAQKLTNGQCTHLFEPSYAAEIGEEPLSRQLGIHLRHVNKSKPMVARILQPRHPDGLFKISDQIMADNAQKASNVHSTHEYKSTSPLIASLADPDWLFLQAPKSLIPHIAPCWRV